MVVLLFIQGPEKDQQQMQKTVRQGKQMDLNKKKETLDYSPRIYYLDSFLTHLVLLNKKSPKCLLLHRKNRK